MGEAEAKEALNFEEDVRKSAEKIFKESWTYFMNRRVSHFRVHVGTNADLEGVKEAVKAMYEEDVVAKTARAMDSVPKMRSALIPIENPYALLMTRIQMDHFEYEGRLLWMPMEDTWHDPNNHRSTILSFYVR